MDPEACLTAIAHGDMAALEQLYHELRVPVFAAALAISADRTLAEDVLQETFVRIFSSAHLYRPGSRPRAWVLTIARNLAFDALRHRRRQPPVADVGSLASTADEAMTTVPDRLEATAALLELAIAEREIVALHLIAGMTHAEIARELRLPPGTVRWKYRLALGRLRARLEAHGG